MKFPAALALAAAIVPFVAAAPVPGPRGSVYYSFDRFFVIVLENTDYKDALNDAYLGGDLLSKGRLLTNYDAITHPSQPNYVAMIGGDTFNVVNDKNVDIDGSIKSIVDSLEGAGVSWASYNENYAGSCSLDASADGGLYRRKHNPFISFESISDNSARCANIKPADELLNDIQAGSVPQYVFYTPNMDNDGHDTSVVYASNWLKGFLEPLLENPVFSQTMFLVTFDEDESHSGSNQVYAVLVGPGATPGSQDDTHYSHYSQLATVEARWNLEPLTKNDAAATPFRIISCFPAFPTSAHSAMIVPHAVAIFAVLASSVSAFTNGTLLPPYLCGPSVPNFAAGTLVGTDGFPKSLGGVLKFFVLPDTAPTVAGFHNQNSIQAQTDLLNVTLNTGGKTIMACKQYTLTAATKSGAALDGLLLFAIDSAGNKVGSFKQFGTAMQPFPGCGKHDVGIIHNQLLSESGMYTGIVWQAPCSIKTGKTITLTGLTVTDTGFGFHMNNFTFAK